MRKESYHGIFRDYFKREQGGEVKHLSLIEHIQLIISSIPPHFLYLVGKSQEPVTYCLEKQGISKNIMVNQANIAFIKDYLA
jgi:hypothetical protein